MKRVELEDRLIDFSVQIIEITSKLKKTRPTNILENQILRSGTSCSMNYGEACGADSNNGFVDKIQIVLMELRETYIALPLINKANFSKDNLILDKGINENNLLISIFVKIIKTFKNF